MLKFIAVICILTICNEAITEVVVKSKLFAPIRDFFAAKKNRLARYVSELLSCGHCFSLWSSMLVVSTVFFTSRDFFPAGTNLVILILYILLIHRMSNYLHFCVDRVDKFYRK